MGYLQAVTSCASHLALISTVLGGLKNAQSSKLRQSAKALARRPRGSPSCDGSHQEAELTRLWSLVISRAMTRTSRLGKAAGRSRAATQHEDKHRPRTLGHTLSTQEFDTMDSQDDIWDQPSSQPSSSQLSFWDAWDGSTPCSPATPFSSQNEHSPHVHGADARYWEEGWDEDENNEHWLQADAATTTCREQDCDSGENNEHPTGEPQALPQLEWETWGICDSGETLDTELSGHPSEGSWEEWLGGGDGHEHLRPEAEAAEQDAGENLFLHHSTCTGPQDDWLGADVTDQEQHLHIPGDGDGIDWMAG
ncbi:hypothetical protein B0T11DRAFT_144507 [Plectosphaerella cucumerina]|uniref:Uncharacterized protein n=1 Tax=Plectosphaerella cucumerina TaxID=40658 RepID=A0A8K0T4Y8_9PEZI|nr:hypothetical protein B0T11DRAFT_144507 [Plectosphaerella cucumerina]